MNILWITNNVLPELAEETGLETSSSGSWLIDLSQKLSESSNINLAIATVAGNEYKKVKVRNITYYLLPGNGRNMLFYTKKYERLWEKIAEDFNVDIVHLHGTEYSHGLSFLRSNPHIKAVVSVQGIISRLAEVYFDGLPKCFSLRYFTISEILKMNNNFAKALLYKHNAKYEREIFKRVSYANTVNYWDTSWTKEFNPNIKCFHLEYNLRQAFYSSEKWNINKIIRHRIFTNPGGDSIKGLHILCKAIAIVKKEYPDVTLVVPGKNIIENIQSGYDKYIMHLISELDIETNILFVGRLSETEMLQHMLKSNAVVIPSAIEGTSLVLREAMYVGVPCIASFRGGMADFIADKEDGFLYDFSEVPYLANRIKEIFSSDSIAKKLSKNAIIKAETAHNRDKNIKDCIDMYQYIYED